MDHHRSGRHDIYPGDLGAPPSGTPLLARHGPWRGRRARPGTHRPDLGTLPSGRRFRL